MSDFQLSWPDTRGSGARFDQYQLCLDPQIEAEIRAVRRLQSLGSSADFQLAPLRLGDSAAARVKFGFDPQRPRLLSDDYQLRLDPLLMAGMGTTETQQQFRHLYSRWLQPDWSVLQQILHRQPPDWWKLRLAQTAAPAVSASSPPRDQGPETPRPAEISDLMKAIWAVPAVKGVARQVVDDTTLSLRRGWRDASGLERGAAIGTAILSAGVVTALLSEQRYREQVLQLIQGNAIPVPGVRGGSVTLLPRGASLKVGIPTLPESTLSGGYQLGSATTSESWNVMIGIDVAQLLRDIR